MSSETSTETSPVPLRPAQREPVAFRPGAMAVLRAGGSWLRDCRDVCHTRPGSHRGGPADCPDGRDCAWSVLPRFDAAPAGFSGRRPDRDGGPANQSRARARKDAGAAAIKELEFDRAMGKLSEADWQEMSGRLRARAARLIRQLDAGANYREQIERELTNRLGNGGDRSTRRPTVRVVRDG